MFPRIILFIRTRQLDADLNNAALSAELATLTDHACPATEEGIRRAEWAGRMYQYTLDFNRGLPKLYTSSHTRALQTAVALSKHWERPASLWQKSDHDLSWPQWIVDPNLCERSWGSATMSWKQFERIYPEEFKEYQRDPFNYRPKFPGAESITDLRNGRVERFLRRIEQDCCEHDLVIVVTHRDWILACRSLVENIDPFQFRIMHNDPKQRIHNLDAVCYTREGATYAGVSYPYPQAVGLIHLPSEEIAVENVEETEWKKIEAPRYTLNELEGLSRYYP